MDAKERWKEDKALAEEQWIEREKQRVDFVIGHNADPEDFPSETIVSPRKDLPYLLLQKRDEYASYRVVRYVGFPLLKWASVWFGQDLGVGWKLTHEANYAWQLGAEWAHRQASCGDEGKL